MPQNRFRQTSRAALLAAIAAAYPVTGYSAPAARVDFAVGNVTAIALNGQSRALAKGAHLDEGETINTNNGRAQLRFTDGAYVSLQPESQFRIDQYRFEGKVDGSEKGLFSLLKGGLRTITGLVGRSNRKNYQISTTVATIGIRGTEYTIQYGQSISGTVGDGEIEVCNGAGCLSVTDGESYYVQSQEIKPVLSNKKTDLPPPAPTNPPIVFQVGENIDPSGIPAGFALLGSQTLDFGGALFSGSTASISFSPNLSMEFDENGTLLSVGGTSVSSVTMNGNDGIMAWGTFQFTPVTRSISQAALVDTTALISGVSLAHFVAGVPADLTGLTGTTGTYSLIGSTPVTDILNATVGSLDDAKVTVNFSGGTSNAATADMLWTINGAPLSAKLSAGFGENTFDMSGSSCGGTCTVTAKLALFGANAPRAGMVYDIGGTFVGAAAFGR